MFVSAIKKIERAMFPIFRLTTIAENNVQWLVVGTGFFIGSNGNFVSVAHVFDNSPPQSRYMFFGHLPNDLHNPPLEIQEVTRDDSNDIFVGRIQLQTPNFLRISKTLPSVGRTVCVAGYPLAVITSNTQGGAELGGVRRYFQPSFVLDIGRARSDNGQGFLRTHEGFLVRDFGLFGMSGGPVFDTSATVLGIQGSVTPPRVSTNGVRSITVENALVIRADLILSLLKDRRIRMN